MNKKVIIWRDIKGYEGWYQVNNKGRLKSLKRGKPLQPSKNKGGYLIVGLSKDGTTKFHYVHTLVAEAFPEICGERFPGAVINHLNEDKTDNRPENLKWVTQKENVNYGEAQSKRVHSLLNNGNYNYFGSGSKAPQAVYQYTKDGKFLKKWDGGAYEAIKSIGKIDASPIYACCNGRRKTYYKSIWKYTPPEKLFSSWRN